jgi:phosphate/sulfate permease
VVGRDDSDELFKAEMLAAPFRMLGAAIAGGFVAFVVFGLAWLPYFPGHSRDVDVLIEMVLRILLTAVVGMAMGVAVAAVRPVRGWPSGIALFILGGVAGLANAAILKDVLSVGCDAGPRLPVSPEWCADGGTLALFVTNALAGLFVAAALLPFGLKRREAAVPLARRT